LEAVFAKPKIAASDRRAATCHDDLYIGVSETRQNDEFVNDAVDSVKRFGRGHPEPADRPLKPFEVILQAEERPIPDRYGLLASVGAKKTPIEKWNSRLLDGTEFTIDISRTGGEALFDRLRGKFCMGSRPYESARGLSVFSHFGSFQLDGRLLAKGL
jgi:hypothetical protein